MYRALTPNLPKYGRDRLSPKGEGEFPFLLMVCMLLLIVTSCNNDYIPKPRGYFRIDFPEKKYTSYTKPACDFSMEIPAYSIVVPDKANLSEPCWINIVFPDQNGTIHLSYKNLSNNLVEYTEDSRSFAYKHTVKADAIDEETVNYPEKKVYGIIYHIQGNAASSLQFYLTDSTTNFIRGALYFDAIPNKDSIAPVADFIKKDIVHLIETFYWTSK